METMATVKDGDIESLIKSLKRKNEETNRQTALAEEADLNSSLNKKRRTELIIAVASVYYFLRKTLNLSRIDLSLEEFETAEAELKKMAEKEERKIYRKCLKLISKKYSVWSHYLEYGYFPITNHPLGQGEKWKKDWWNSHPLSYSGASKNYEIQNLDQQWFAIPPNHQALLKQLFEKRYPQAEKSEPKIED